MDIKVFYSRKQAKIDRRLASAWRITCRVLAWMASGVAVIFALAFFGPLNGAHAAICVTIVSFAMACGLIVFEYIVPYAANDTDVFLLYEGRIYCEKKVSHLLNLCYMIKNDFIGYKLGLCSAIDNAPDHCVSTALAYKVEALENADILTIEWIGNSVWHEGLSAEAIDKVSLTPIRNGYKIEYCASFYELYGLAPTQVSIKKNFVDYDELVTLLQELQSM